MLANQADPLLLGQSCKREFKETYGRFGDLLLSFSSGAHKSDLHNAGGILGIFP